MGVGVGKGGIVNVRISGDLVPDSMPKFAEWTNKVKKVIKDQFGKTNEKVLCLVDITDLKRYAPEAMVQLASLMKDNEPYVLRTATFGGNSYTIMAEDVVIALSGRNNLKAFKTEDEALEWLREGDTKAFKT